MGNVESKIKYRVIIQVVVEKVGRGRGGGEERRWIKRTK